MEPNRISHFKNKNIPEITVQSYFRENKRQVYVANFTFRHSCFWAQWRAPSDWPTPCKPRTHLTAPKEEVLEIKLSRWEFSAFPEDNRQALEQQPWSPLTQQLLPSTASLSQPGHPVQGWTPSQEIFLSKVMIWYQIIDTHLCPDNGLNPPGKCYKTP